MRCKTPHSIFIQRKNTNTKFIPINHALKCDDYHPRMEWRKYVHTSVVYDVIADCWLNRQRSRRSSCSSCCQLLNRWTKRYDNDYDMIAWEFLCEKICVLIVQAHLHPLLVPYILYHQRRANAAIKNQVQ